MIPFWNMHSMANTAGQGRPMGQPTFHSGSPYSFGAMRSAFTAPKPPSAGGMGDAPAGHFNVPTMQRGGYGQAFRPMLFGETMGLPQGLMTQINTPADQRQTPQYLSGPAQPAEPSGPGLAELAARVDQLYNLLNPDWNPEVGVIKGSEEKTPWGQKYTGPAGGNRKLQYSPARTSTSAWVANRWRAMFPAAEE